MEWLKISTSTELVRVATDDIVYVHADGNYCDMMLTNGKSHKMTFQLVFFEKTFLQLRNKIFVRVGRSLIVNKRFIYVINLVEQKIILTGGDMREQVVFHGGEGESNNYQKIPLSRETLKQLKELLEIEKG